VAAVTTTLSKTADSVSNSRNPTVPDAKVSSFTARTSVPFTATVRVEPVTVVRTWYVLPPSTGNGSAVGRTLTGWPPSKRTNTMYPVAAGLPYG
jgi:hypothetical protein